MKIGFTLRSAGQDRSTWLVLLFLLLGVVAPTVCVLWFMNEAATGQAEAAKQSVTEAYRGQLRFFQEKIDAYWEKRAASLQKAAGAGKAADFARNVRAGMADSFVFPDYPSRTGVISVDHAADRADWRTAMAFEERRNAQAAIAAWAEIAKSDADPSTAARAAQAQIRWLIRSPGSGGKEAAVRAIDKYFDGGRIARGTDLEGRLIAADEQLLRLHLMHSRDSRRLVSMLNDYEHSTMPAAQRLFLMDEVQALAQDTVFPTRNAERLAAQFLEADDVHPAGSGLQATRVPDLWKLVTKSGGVFALYRTATVMTAMRSVLDENGKSVKFDATPPGVPAGPGAIAAGAMLPGWQLSFSILDTKLMDEAAHRRTVSYLWAGYVVIGAMAFTGLLVGQSFRKQMRLARLKTDLVAAVSHELKTPLSSMRLLVDSLLTDADFDAQKTREYLELVAGENLRLTRLVENFLTFARIERNRQRMAFQQITPGEVAASAANIACERFHGAGCCFTVDIERGLSAIQADPDALLTALVNLLDNAYKYTPSEKRICLRAYSEEQHVVFAIEDNGIGIAPREHKRIFRRFYQVDARLARETGGCGLGLSIVESIVRAHGGSVRVTSRMGSGSTFSVCLPAEKATA